MKVNLNDVIKRISVALFLFSFFFSTESEDYTRLWNTLREKVSLVKYDTASPGQGTFGHIVNGYDAGYYGYSHTLHIESSIMILFNQIHILPGLCRRHVCDRI